MNNASPIPSATGERVFQAGDRVWLKAARFGLPGVVLKMDRGKAVIFWRDLDYLARHRACTLELAEGVNDGGK